jgi:CRP-like cAMP-binding protein
VAKRITSFEKAETIYSQGESCSTVLYINSGLVKLSTITEDGKEGVIALLADGGFLGEACLSEAFSEHAAQATAMEPTTIFGIQRKEMSRVLREEPDFRNYFISYLLRRSARIEADLIDQLAIPVRSAWPDYFYFLPDRAALDRPNSNLPFSLKKPWRI